MKKIYVLFCLIVLVFLLQSGTRFHTVPPAGRTGATGVYCNSCHGGAAANPINSGGGNISVLGLPGSTGYVLGQSYPFSITIQHGAKDRLRWGFSISARTSTGAAVGTFSTTNPFAAINTNTTVLTQELSHLNTVIIAASDTYTFDNLTWTAPTTNATPDGNITFYYVGNATNGNGANTGDFIYAGSSSVALPIDLKDFTANVLTNNNVILKWETASEQNSDFFYVQKSDDGQLYYNIAKVAASGNSTSNKEYSYTDKIISSYNKPVFYRLQLNDKDGKFKLSKTVSVQLKNDGLFVQNLYPSVVRKNSYVTANVVSDKVQPMQIDLIDIHGRILQTNRKTLNIGTNLIDVQMPSNLPSEWIFVRFGSGNFKQVMPLVVNL